MPFLPPFLNDAVSTMVWGKQQITETPQSRLQPICRMKTACAAEQNFTGIRRKTVTRSEKTGRKIIYCAERNELSRQLLMATIVLW
jgi:hypothetical protein